MKYQAYAEYKDSGVEWLEAIPSHWDIKKLKFIANVQPSNIDKKTNEGEIPILLCNYTDVYYNDTVNVTMEFMKASATEEQIKKFTLQAGDTIITKDSEDPNDIAIPTFVPEDLVGVVCGYHLSVIRPYDMAYGEFIKRLFECGYARAYFATRSNGLTRYGLGTYALDNIFYPKPPEIEATTIANFLDHETAKIDTLIEKQQQLIKLLKEKRQAVISHAVTKGLNPNAPMRDSGVEWLGEVPEHWEVVPLKHIANIKYGIGEPPKYTEEGISLIRATNIRSGKISNINLVFVNPDDIPANRIIWLEVGDIIVVRSGAGTGDSSIIPKEYEGSIAGFDMVVKPIKCIPTFLGHALLSNYVRDNQMDLEKARAAQPHLNAEELGGCFILLPPKKEQGEIDQYLMRELSKFDLLMRQVDKASVLLQERRTALISAAVTGKIDVRNWQAPEPLYSNKETHKEEAA